MKRLLLALLLVIASTQLFAQQGSAIDRFFQKYESDQSFTLIRYAGRSKFSESN
jgi:hypothetical protein